MYALLQYAEANLTGCVDTASFKICFSILYKVFSINLKKEPPPESQQRYLFLFKNLLILTKPSSKSTKNNPVYAKRENIPLYGLEITLFHT